MRSFINKNVMKEKWKSCGYVDEPLPADTDLKSAIRALCAEKNAVILAHYYTEPDVQDVADVVGDSLALAQRAADLCADIIVMCGVHFMGETCKILCPEKKVLIPDLNASCSLADSCPADRFAEFTAAHPDHKVVSYVNTSAAVKALTDVVVTSGNARRIVDSFPPDAKLIFGPDQNLGRYINAQTGRHMLLWPGACHVHERFSAEGVKAMKERYPGAPVLVHPECRPEVTALADVVGSTAVLLKYAAGATDCHTFIVVTESGILHQMQKQCPDKQFVPVPPADGSGACNECGYMRLCTLAKVYNTLRYEWPEITVDRETAQKAVLPIRRMLELS